MDGLQTRAYIVALFSAATKMGTADKARPSADKRVLARSNPSVPTSFE